ncbi:MULTISPECIES: hypothetical protein [unclassified Saccharothrix]|uniref:hypothetical protein n=1 Tax=unclassified Saccharothrix TaxID=2593673 RepID=UPI00307DBDC6
MGLHRWWVAAGAFAVGVVGLLLWLSGRDEALDTGDKLASVAGAVIAFAGLVTSVIALVVAVRAGRSTDLEQAADTLARLVARQWEREADARGLTRPLDVRWTSTSRPVAPAPAEIAGDTRVKRLRLHGTVAGLADSFHQLPARQLVVIGEPGAGKTSAAILLTIGLAERRGPGDPVPLLLPLSAWNPAEHDVEEWIVHRLTVDHPSFGKRGVFGPQVARALVDKGMVLPVLDGLDEVAPAGREAAFRGIARAVGRRRPLVLTSRSAEYEDTVGGLGVPIGRAAVVELGTVHASAAADYLAAGVPEGDTRWAPVVSELRDHPDGAVARALQTPLAVYLAKTAYTSPATDPEDLLVHETPEAVENHLLDAYLPALYPRPDRALRRFAFLARRMARRPGADLAWWRLFLLLPGPHVLVAATRGAFIALAYMSVMTILMIAGSDRDTVVPIAVLVVIAGVAVGTLGAVLGGLRGLVWLGVARLTRRGEEWLVHSPRYGFVGPRTALGLLAFGGVMGAVGFGINGLVERVAVTWLEVAGGAALGATVVVNIGFAPRIKAAVPVHPAVSLAADRRIALTLGLATVVGLTFVFQSMTSSVEQMWVAVVVAFFVASAWPLSCAWVKFEIVRFWFWVFRKMPWRLMGFMEDAHRRGVLRQVGGSYQFRHLRLQEYFAGR